MARNSFFIWSIHEHFLRLAAEKGFQAEPLEKAVGLLELLEALSRHPFLKDRIALKGGTALLTREAQMQTVLHSHPGLRWKALNVAEYRMDSLPY